MAMDYNDWSQEADVTLEECIQDAQYVEPPFDERVLTREQRVKLDELCIENPTLTRSDLAAMIRLNLMSHRAYLEGRELTSMEIMEAHELKEVIYWVPPTQLEGTCDSTLEIHNFEDIHMPCIEEVTSSLHTLLFIDECYDLIHESQRLDTLRVEKLARDYHEICFDVEYICALNKHDLEFKFSMPKESRSLLEKSYLGDVLDIDVILNEIKNPKVEIDSRNEDVVFYMIDGDEVDYFVMNSFTHEVDFIFPLNAFDPSGHSIIKEYFKIYATFVVNFIDEWFIYLPWAIVCDFAHIVYCVIGKGQKDHWSNLLILMINIFRTSVKLTTLNKRLVEGNPLVNSLLF